MDLIYESKMLGISVKVFADRLEYKAGWGIGVESIPIEQIVRIKLGDWLTNTLKIETTNGRRLKIVTSKKREVANALQRAQQAYLAGPQAAPALTFMSISPALLPVATNATGSFLRTIKRVVLVGGAAAFALVLLVAIVGPKKTPVAAHSHAARAATTGNKANDLLLEEPADKQAYYLAKAVPGCTGTRAFYMGVDGEKSASWSVACSNGSNYLVAIDNDEVGSMSAVNCLAMSAMVNIDCFSSLASQSGRPAKTSQEFMCGIATLPPDVREETIRNFMHNIETYLRDSGERVPPTREAVIKQFLKKLDKDARACKKAPAKQRSTKK